MLLYRFHNYLISKSKILAIFRPFLQYKEGDVMSSGCKKLEPYIRVHHRQYQYCQNAQLVVHVWDTIVGAGKKPAFNLWLCNSFQSL